MSRHTLFRYPGGKSKLIKQIIKLSEDSIRNSSIYIEPFFGGGSIGLYVLENYNNIEHFILNDKDSDLVNLWNGVINVPQELIKLIEEYIPSVESFYKFKEELENGLEKDLLLSGFKKLAVQQLSYSGLGCKAGGPIGGVSQKSDYKVDCRWSPKYLKKNILRFHELFLKRGVYEIFNVDFKDCLINNNYKEVFSYLDPPYYVKGNDLYVNGFTTKDHETLGKILKDHKGNWALSYDKADFIEGLYKDIGTINNLSVNYTITTSRNRQEILIVKK